MTPEERRQHRIAYLRPSSTEGYTVSAGLCVPGDPFEEPLSQTIRRLKEGCQGLQAKPAVIVQSFAEFGIFYVDVMREPHLHVGIRELVESTWPDTDPGDIALMTERPLGPDFSMRVQSAIVGLKDDVLVAARRLARQCMEEI